MSFPILRGRASVPARALITGLCWLGLTTTAAGATTPADSIDLARALQLTLAQNRELQAYPFDRNRAEALELQAGLRPVPRLELNVENALGNGAYERFDSSETTLALSQLVELGDKREKRLSAARAYSDQLTAEYELSRLDVLAETGRRYYQLLRLQLLQSLNQQRASEERKAYNTIASRAAAGAAAQADAAKLDLRLARSIARGEQLANEHTLARGRLAAMWQGAAGFDRVAGRLGSQPPLAPLESLLGDLGAAPQLAQAIALQRLADTQVELAQANGRSDLSLGIGLRHLEDSGDQALVFSVAMPLAFSNPNRGRIAAAQADRELSARQAELIEQQLVLELSQLYQQLLNNRARIRQLQQELLPRAHTLQRETLAGYRQGQFSVLQWTDAQAERFALEQELIERQYSAQLQLLELERISGRPLAEPLPGDLS